MVLQGLSHAGDDVLATGLLRSPDGETLAPSVKHLLSTALDYFVFTSPLRHAIVTKTSRASYFISFPLCSYCRVNLKGKPSPSSHRQRTECGFEWKRSKRGDNRLRLGRRNPKGNVRGTLFPCINNYLWEIVEKKAFLMEI